MTFYFYIFLFIGLLIIVLAIRFFVLRKKNLSLELFFKALKFENSGQYEEALVTYESALVEVNKIKFHSSLKNKIVEKLKVLHTYIDYKNDHRFK